MIIAKPPGEDLVDSLDNLPTDVSTEENTDDILRRLEHSVKTQKRQKMGLTAKEVGYATILFVFLSLPISNKIYAMAVPSSEDSPIILTTLKAITFFIILYIIVHPWNK